MIYIKRHNLIFMKVPKNASTALSHFLIENMVSPEDLVSRTLYDPNKREPKIFYNHISKDSAHMDLDFATSQGFISPMDIDRSRIIGVIRHPAERLLSMYLYIIKRNMSILKPNKLVKVSSPEHFQTLIREGDGVLKDIHWFEVPQASFLKYQGTPLGEWWPYEAVTELAENIAHTYNVDVKYPLRHTNRSSETETANLLSEYYDDATYDLVYNRNREDFELYEDIKWK